MYIHNVCVEMLLVLRTVNLLNKFMLIVYKVTKIRKKNICVYLLDPRHHIE